MRSLLQRPAVLLAFITVSIVWGTTFFAIRIGVEHIPPFLMAGLRQLTAGLILLIYCVIRGIRFPKPKQWIQLAIPGILMIALGNGLVSWGETTVNSGLAAILSAMTPVWVLLITLLFAPGERVHPLRVTGVFIGFAGIVVLFYPELTEPLFIDQVPGLVAIALANMSWAAGTVYVSRHQTDASPLMAAGSQMLIAGAVLLMASAFTERDLPVAFTREATLSLVYLIIFGSVITYAAFLFLLKNLSATGSSAYAYINTIVAVFLGWLFLDEPLNSFIALGATITLIGVYFVRRTYPKKS